MKRLAALVLLLGLVNGCATERGAERFACAMDGIGNTAGLVQDLVALTAPPDDPGPPPGPNEVEDVYVHGSPGPNDAPPAPQVTAPDPKHVWFDATPALASIHAVDLSACEAHGAARGYGHARVTFDGSGAATRVVIEAPDGLSKDAVKCLGDSLAQASAAPFDGSPVTVGSSFFVR